MALLDNILMGLGIGSEVAGTALSAKGNLMRGQAAVAAAQRRKAGLESEAKQYEVQAGQAKAEGQRTAYEIGLQTNLINSAALARAAASGAGASDPSVVTTVARTAGQGAYQQAMAIYGGDVTAQNLQYRAAVSRYEGATGTAAAEDTLSASRIAAASNVLSGAGKIATMAMKYWQAPGTVTIGESGGKTSIGDYGAS